MDQYPTAASLSYPDAPLRQQVLHVLAQHPTGFTPLSMGGFGTCQCGPFMAPKILSCP